MYIYDRDGRVIPDDWFNKAKYPCCWETEQRVGRTRVRDWVVATVWLFGMDQICGGECPLIFETMIFGKTYNHELRRYSSEEDAMRGYLAAVDALRAGHHPFWNDVS